MYKTQFSDGTWVLFSCTNIFLYLTRFTYTFCQWHSYTWNFHNTNIFICNNIFYLTKYVITIILMSEFISLFNTLFLFYKFSLFSVTIRKTKVSLCNHFSPISSKKYRHLLSYRLFYCKSYVLISIQYTVFKFTVVPNCTYYIRRIIIQKSAKRIRDFFMILWLPNVCFVL